MTLPIVTIVLNLLVLTALAGTIYYAAGLSRALESLRGSRGDFSRRLTDLTEAIAKAQSTIADLRETGDTASVELKNRVSAAQSLNTELAEVTAAAEALAGRLETLSERGRRAVAPNRAPERAAEVPTVRPAPRPKPAPSSRPANAAPRQDSPFSIRDPEFEGAKVYSRAEAALLDALRKRRAQDEAGGP